MSLAVEDALAFLPPILLPPPPPNVPLSPEQYRSSIPFGPQASGWTLDSRACLTNDCFLPLSGKPRQDWGCHCSVPALQ